MRKDGIFLLENMLSLILIFVVGSTILLSVNCFKSIYDEYSHSKFKMGFLNFVNYGKYRAVNEGLNYTLYFYKDYITLNQSPKVVAKFKFPNNIKMIDFNGIKNRELNIKTDGSINRGATFSYKFGNNSYKISIDTITGRVNYE